MVVDRCKCCGRIADGLQEVGLHCGLKDKFIAEKFTKLTDEIDSLWEFGSWKGSDVERNRQIDRAGALCGERTRLYKLVSEFMAKLDPADHPDVCGKCQKHFEEIAWFCECGCGG